MDNDKFINLCKSEVCKYHNDKVDTIKYDDNFIFIGPENVYVVWLCKTLQNNKALLSTTLSDGMYYELTYNGDKKELYLDAYEKTENKCIKVEEE